MVAHSGPSSVYKFDVHPFEPCCFRGRRNTVFNQFVDGRHGVLRLLQYVASVVDHGRQGPIASDQLLCEGQHESSLHATEHTGEA